MKLLINLNHQGIGHDSGIGQPYGNMHILGIDGHSPGFKL